MSGRIIDRGIWLSKKLNQVPEKYRFHYANWIPLAEANGVFEADPEIIWAKVYAYQFPFISKEEVTKILVIFGNVGLLQVWTDNGKVWAYFNGMEKAGRLPSGKHLDRYKNLPPEPPGKSRKPPESPPWFGIGLDRFGVGMGLDSHAHEKFTEEEIMAIAKRIKDIAASEMQFLGWITDRQAQELATLALAWGSQDLLVANFTDWCHEHAGDEIGYPISAYLKEAKNRLPSAVQKMDTHPDLDSYCVTLYEVSGQSPAGKALLGVGAYLTEFGLAETDSAFREFYASLDDFQSKRAVDTFFKDGAGRTVILARRKRAADTKALEEASRRKVAELQEQAARDIAEAERSENEQAREAERALEDIFGKTGD